MSQSSDSLLFYLSYSLSCKTKILSYLLKSHLLSTDTEKIFNNISFSLRKSRKSTLNLLVKGLVYKSSICIRRVTVYQYIKQTIILSIHKRSIYRDVTSGYSKRIGNFIARNIENIRQLFRRGHTLIFLLKLGESFINFIKRANLIKR